jgi:hypothetical protein
MTMSTEGGAEPLVPLCPEFAVLDLAIKAIRSTSWSQHRDVIIPRCRCTLLDPATNRWRVDLISGHKGKRVFSATFIADLIDEAGDRTRWRAENVVLLRGDGMPF